MKIRNLAFQILILTSFLVSLFLAKTVLAQETPEETARRHGVTFPIAELGNCKTFAECRNYCEDPVNRNVCIDFAKKKGFYKEERIEARRDLLEDAKTGLGCTSIESCKAICEQPVNFEKCNDFAKSHSISGGHEEDPAKVEILAKAKEVLGCDSYQSCKAYCENPANRQKCSDFAREVGLRGGEEHKGPGGCTTAETCRAFCSDPNNFQVCSGYSSSTGRRFSGPGGCTDETSCRSYCQSHPQECGYYGGGNQYNPQEMCSKTPNCTWTGTTCQCGGSSGGTYTPYPTTSKSPETYCVEHGCSWTGTSCSCPSGNYTPYPTTSSYDPATECAKTSGCSWTGTTCQCSGSSGSTSYTPYPYSSPHVYGTSTAAGLLQTLLNYLANLLGR